MPFLALDSTTRDLQLLEEEFVRCIRRRDPERLVETFYAPDAELQAPGHPVVNGREAILAWLRREFENGLIELRREANHFEAEHSLACASGRFTLTRETQPGILCTKEGCFTSVFRRQPDGHWRVVIDCLTLVR
jgi:ketosteroid isomerase-like protein